MVLQWNLFAGWAFLLLLVLKQGAKLLAILHQSKMLGWLLSVLLPYTADAWQYSRQRRLQRATK